MQPPTTVRCWELAAAELRGSVGTYMRWRSALRGPAWTTLSHSHRDSYAARPIRAEGLAPCDSVRALASLSAAFYKHSVP